MSSHHIVKEKQEPALYIHHLGNFEEEYLGQLLEWSPTLLVNAAEYEKTISLGLKVDIVIGEIGGVQVQESTQIIPAESHSLTTAINYLITEKYPAVHIIANENDFDALIQFLPSINLVLFTATAKTYPIKSGFSIWKPAGSNFSIHASTPVETTNLKQQKNGSFMVQEDGFVKFDFASEYVFLTELL